MEEEGPNTPHDPRAIDLPRVPPDICNDIPPKTPIVITFFVSAGPGTKGEGLDDPSPFPPEKLTGREGKGKSLPTEPNSRNKKTAVTYLVVLFGFAVALAAEV